MVQDTRFKSAYLEKMSLFLKMYTYSCSPTYYNSESPKIMPVGQEMPEI